MARWDTPEWRTERDAKLLAWMCGNKDAVDTVLALSTIAEVWDDLYDGDKPTPKEMVNRAFSLALVDLQVNEFYKANEALFYALTVTSINGWLDANEWQRSVAERERMTAFYLRNLGIEIVMLAVFRAGGWEHLRKVSLEIRSYFDHEEFKHWNLEHAPIP